VSSRVDYRGSWVLVTGASSGLGEEFARKFAERGAHLVVAARSLERLERLAGDLARVNGVTVRPVAVDLSTRDGTAELLARVRESGTFIEHLVNNAGFGSAGPFASLDGAREASMVRLNMEAVVVLTRGLLEPMIAAGRGGVINVASTAAFQPVPFMSTYGATKAFVLSFTLGLATELRSAGVRALALCPGPVRTGFQQAAGFAVPPGRLSELSAKLTVERGLRAYDRGDDLCVPGFVNTAQTYATKLLPRRLVGWGTLRAMQRLGRTGKPRP
jgi:uncharacterized protein